MKRKALKAAFPYTVPIFAGFWFLGLTYGIYMNVLGFSFWYPMLMSLTIFAGSMEFVTVNYTADIPEDVDKGWFMFFVTLLNHFYWFFGVTLGGISGRQTDSKIHTVSWQCIASGSLRTIGDLLPEECEPFYRQSWFARIRFCWTCCDLALLEAADASVNCRRNTLLYAFGAVCILGSFFVCFVLQ